MAPRLNLRSVDLNLLVALDALLEERHVTRAAARVGLSQPAMSNALARLRALFGDELLVRTRAGMEPTAKAVRLGEATRRALQGVQRVLEDGEAFRPATADRAFALRMSDVLTRLVLPAVAARLRAEAPGVALDVVHLPPARTVDALEAGEIDLAVSMGLRHGGSIASEAALPDRMVCLMRAGHPAAEAGLTLDGFLALGHVKVSISPTDARFVDDALARLGGHRRRILVNLPHWLAVPEVVRASDLVAVMPERLAALFTGPGAGVVARVLPFASEPFHWALYWHRRNGGAADHAWLRGLVADVMRGMAPGAAIRQDAPTPSRASAPRTLGKPSMGLRRAGRSPRAE